MPFISVGRENSRAMEIDRRRFLSTAAMTVAADHFGMTGWANAQANQRIEAGRFSAYFRRPIRPKSGRPYEL